MPNLDAVLDANRAAVDELVRAAEAAHSNWSTPRAPGKWSPQQIVEHVALSLEEAGHVVTGQPTKLPTLPVFLRPLARVVFNRTLKTARFPKSRTSRKMDPALSALAGPPTPAEARTRLEAGLARFESACRAKAAAGGPVESGGFGRVSLEDYARFTELHTRHHTQQIPVVL
jgi:hypothetical protein